MKKLLTLAAFAVVALVGVGTQAHAQDSCIIVDGVKCYVFNNPDGTQTLECENGTKGSGTFSTKGQDIPKDGPVNATLIADAVTASAESPTYGTITTSVDPDRQAVTTITSNDQTQRYPLTVDLQFYGVVTLKTSDVKYKSRTPLQFVNKEVNSLLPFSDVKLELVSDVEFYDPASEDVTAFTLQKGSGVTLSGGSGGGDR